MSALLVQGPRGVGPIMILAFGPHVRISLVRSATKGGVTSTVVQIERTYLGWAAVHLTSAAAALDGVLSNEGSAFLAGKSWLHPPHPARGDGEPV